MYELGYTVTVIGIGVVAFISLSMLIYGLFKMMIRRSIK